MNDIIPRKIKTGGDPRTLPDYTALRDELSKLTHPARPDVNWRHVEKLCLSLFEQNGVELQTLAWYTLARTQLAGLFGLNEGLAILEALISHQWGGDVATAGSCPHGNPQQSESASAATDALAPAQLQRPQPAVPG